MVRPTFDEYFLDIAKAVSARADCTRRRVGAVIVKDNRIISTGYNGAPAGAPGCLTDGACPRGRYTHKELPLGGDYNNCLAIHAEANALLYAWQSLVGAALYSTEVPCFDCAKLIKGAGIQRVITPLY